MYISKEEKQFALRVSKHIQHYLEITNGTNQRSTDVFPYLQRQGLFKKDKDNGKELRYFLKKLIKANMLKSLIPQCNYIPSLTNPNYGEWFFHDAKDKMPKSKPQKVNKKIIKKDPFQSNELKKRYAKMDINEAIDIVKMLIAGINPITERFQDDLGVCADITVIEALKTIIDPECYETEIEKLSNEIESDRSELNQVARLKAKVIDKKPAVKYLSGSALGRLKNKSYDEVLLTMKQNNLILTPTIIRKNGVELGLKIKENAKGNKWIVYPESLAKLL